MLDFDIYIIRLETQIGVFIKRPACIVLKVIELSTLPLFITHSIVLRDISSLCDHFKPHNINVCGFFLEERFIQVVV